MFPELSPVAVAVLGLQLAGIIGLRYFLVSGAFAWVAARRKPDIYRPDDPERRARLARQVRREIGWSSAAVLVYAAPAALAFAAFEAGGTRVYLDVGDFPLWWWPASVLLYLAVHDAWFYWTHRAMHHWPRLFRAVHAVHHESRPPTAFASMSFHPWEALSAAWLYPLLVLLVPIHWSALATVAAIATFMAVTNHMGFEIFPRAWVHGWFGRLVITASHHDLHHQRYNSNYGLYFRFWDRRCRTDAGLRERF